MSKYFARILVVLWPAALLLVPASSSDASPKQLNCEIGAVTKTYGKTEWLVYSCDDDRSLVVVTAPRNPATPFVFTFFANENGHSLHGEGTGNQEATDAAYQDLSKLTEADIAALVAQTKAKS